MALQSDNQELEERLEEKENQPANQTWFHGGIAGLAVGDHILPPSLTQARCCAKYGARGWYSRDRVYITTSFDVAFPYAALISICPGWVYEVLPVGAVEPDPDPSDSLVGWSYHCDKALIVAVVHRCTRDDMRLTWRKTITPPVWRFLVSVLEADGVRIE